MSPSLGFSLAVVVCSAERESKRLDAGIKKLDLEQSIGDGLLLSDQLIKPLFGKRADALVVNVDAVSSTGRLSIDQHAKLDRCSGHCWAHTR